MTGIITLWQTQHGFKALSRPQKKLWVFEVPEPSAPLTSSPPFDSVKIHTLPANRKQANRNTPVKPIGQIQKAAPSFPQQAAHDASKKINNVTAPLTIMNIGIHSCIGQSSICIAPIMKNNAF